MSDTTTASENSGAQRTIETTENAGGPVAGAAAAGGVVGGVFVVSCCAIPMYLMSIGITGAMTMSLMALAPYRLYFTYATAAIVLIGVYLIYLRPILAYRQGKGGKPHYTTISAIFIQFGLWLSAAGAGFGFAWPYVNRYLF